MDPTPAEQYEKEKDAHIFVLPVYIIRAILWVPALFLVHFLLRMEVRGRENIKGMADGKVVFAANHNSEIDPYAFQYALWFPSPFVPLYFVSLTKKYYPFSRFGLRSLYYGGIFFKLMGAYPVFKGLYDYEKTFVNHIKILTMGHSVLIFPEGSIKNKDVTQTKPGYIYLAKRTNATIVPVCIDGLQNLTFCDVVLRKRKLVITFGAPVRLDAYTDEELDPRGEKIQEVAVEIMRSVNSMIKTGEN